MITVTFNTDLFHAASTKVFVAFDWMLNHVVMLSHGNEAVESLC